MVMSETTKLNLWQWLTRPDQTLNNPEDVQRSRLLAIVALILTVAAGIAYISLAIFRPTVMDDPDTVLTMAGVAGAIVAYTLNRWGKYDLAATIFIVASTISTLFAPYFPASSTTMIVLSLLPVLLTAFFYSIRWVLAVTGINIFAHTILIFTGQNTDSGYIDAFLIMFVVNAVIVGFMIHQREIENIRRSELEKANDALRKSEAELEDRVEQRTRDLFEANKQLAVALGKAQEADRIKSQFLASMSHELRTPLNAILNFSKLMRKGIMGPVTDHQVDTLNEVVGSGQLLLALINDVLDVSKIQSGMLSLFVEEDIDIYPIFETGISTVESLIKDKPVKLIKDIDSNLPTMLCDRRRVTQVLLNLLSNAAKFTDEGTITLSAKKKDDELLVAVIDTGAGVPEEQHETIFEPFIQTEAGIKHSGGTGLGLPITKSLIEAHGGRVWMESTPGKGSSFMFTLPVNSPELRERYETGKEAAYA